MLLAGPACVGKTTVVDGLEAGRLPSLSERLGLEDLSSWTYLTANDLPALQESRLERMMLHYSLPGPWDQKHGTEADPYGRIRGLIESSDEVTFVTFWASPKALLERVKTRRARLLIECLNIVLMRANLQSITRLRRRQKAYSNPDHIFLSFNDWFEFCDAHAAKAHWVVDTTEQTPELLSLPEFRESRRTG